MLRPVLAALLLLLCRPVLAAYDVSCVPAEEGAITVDGLLPDWREIPGGLTLDEPKDVIMGREAWNGPNDLSVTVKCVRTEHALFLAFDVRDNYFVRMREAKPGEDHVQLFFSDGDSVQTVNIYPSDLKGVPRKVTGPARLTKSLQIAEARQMRGYSVEVKVPLAAIPGFSARAMAIRGGVAVADCDSKVSGKTEKVISSSDGHARASQLGRFTFGEMQDVVGHFLKQQGLSPRDVTFDKTVEMGGDPGLERVILAGPYIGIFAEEYHYIRLNVQSPRDISGFQLLNLAGDGKHAIVVKTIERARNGSRQILHVFKLVGAGIQRPFAIEIAKQAGPNKLVSKVSFVKWKKHTDIVVEAGHAEGWNEKNYQEAPADDVVPILLPWGEKKKTRFRFTGNEYEEVR